MLNVLISIFIGNNLNELKDKSLLGKLDSLYLT